MHRVDATRERCHHPLEQCGELIGRQSLDGRDHDASLVRNCDPHRRTDTRVRSYEVTTTTCAWAPSDGLMVTASERPNSSRQPAVPRAASATSAPTARTWSDCSQQVVHQPVGVVDHAGVGGRLRKGAVQPASALDEVQAGTRRGGIELREPGERERIDGPALDALALAERKQRVTRVAGGSCRRRRQACRATCRGA